MKVRKREGNALRKRPAQAAVLAASCTAAALAAGCPQTDKGGASAPGSNVLAAAPVSIQTPVAAPTPPPDDTADVVAYLRWLQQFEAQRQAAAGAQDNAARQALRTANPVAVREAYEKAAAERREDLRTFQGHPAPAPCARLAADYGALVQYDYDLLRQTEDLTVRTAESDRGGNMVSARAYQDQLVTLAQQDAAQRQSRRNALLRDLAEIRAAYPRAPDYVFLLFPDQTQQQGL